MTRVKRAALLVLSHTVAIAVGAFAAYEFFIRDGVRGMTALGDLSVDAMQDTLVDLQRTTGTDQEYEAALKDYLSILDRLRAAHPDSPDNVHLRGSKSRVLARLALVAEKRGARDESAQYMQAAIRECQAVGRGDCSEQKLHEVAV